ncbi:hypothetical protein RirG_005610 [Rhizophagus irregularis DAOM 197198w]|uniref:Uncharacterized protein n=1 Tax=Rhizophagus irregularis (strain DAOM 197198w) TaxID=1432141 RepID=A0A015NJ24_RHIIW|nr:hypothetical protein RirG_005610 [Rhizophagus irregularis DAOM 197198w]
MKNFLHLTIILGLCHQQQQQQQHLQLLIQPQLKLNLHLQFLHHLHNKKIIQLLKLKLDLHVLFPRQVSCQLL